VQAGANNPPSVSLTGPADGSFYPIGATIPITASASDVDGTVTKIDFYQGSTLLGSDSLVPYSFTWTNAPAGTYAITAQATDDKGAVTTSNPISIQVQAASTPGLTVPDLSGLDGKTYSLTDEIGFTYPVSGVTFAWEFAPDVMPAEAGTQSMHWAPASAGVTSRAAATTASPRFTPIGAGLRPGTYQLTVTVTLGSQSKSATPVTINLVSTDLSTVKVYPNPWRSDKHADKSVTFAGLPLGTTIKIFTVSGHEVKELHADGPSILWDLKTESGNKVASGLYIYLVTDSQGNKVRGKLAIIK